MSEAPGRASCRAPAVLSAAVRAARSTRARWAAHQAASPGAVFSPSRRCPVAPSTSSRTMSACPACRWVSAVMWTRLWCSVTALRSPHGTRPTASSGSAAMVPSACAQAARYCPAISSRLSSGVAQKSAFGSASPVIHGRGASKGRPKVSPK